MSNKFKVGPAKTVQGNDVVILSTEGKGIYPIVGQQFSGGSWKTTSWSPGGDHTADRASAHDLVPNNLPIKFECLSTLRDSKCGDGSIILFNMTHEARQLFGKTVRVTIEEIVK